MRDLIVTTMVSLDGVAEAPGGGDHPHAGWTFQAVEFDPAAYDIKGREQTEAGALVLGRRSYEEFAPVWPTMDDFALYNEMPKYVVSGTLPDPLPPTDWRNCSLLRTLDDVAALKQGDGGPLLVHGSLELARGLAAAGLVDRYHLLVFPVLLGGGRRLFGEHDDLQRLRLTEHETYGNGVRMAVYDVVR